MAYGVRASICAVAFVALSSVAAAQSPQLRDANGALVGIYAGGVGSDDVSRDDLTTVLAPAVRIISHRGYIAAVSLTGGRITFGLRTMPTNIDSFYGAFAAVKRYFVTPDCTGQGYVVVNSPPGEAVGGFVFSVPGSSYTLMYTPKGELGVERMLQSRRDGGSASCDPPFDSKGRASLPVYPNDPAETGVPNVPFVPPITIESAESAWLLFRDGYESALVLSVRGRLKVA